MGMSLMEKKLLVVNSATPKKSYILARLKELGVKLICLNTEKKDWAEQYVDEWILADTFDHVASIQQVELFIRIHPESSPDGVITFWEDDVLLTSKLSDYFGWIGIPLSISSKTRNKYSFREFCQENNLPAPHHTTVKTEADVTLATQQFTFPLVVKPAYGSHSAFVIKAGSEAACREAVRYIQEHLSVAVESALTDGLDIIVEEYLDGQEVDVDLLVQRGTIVFSSITDNEKTNEPYFVETGESIPSALPAATQAEIVALASQTVQKLGIQNGCLHFEAKATSRGPFPIEVNLRMGGGEVYFFNNQCWGVDLVENGARIALGVPCHPKKAASPLAYIATEQFLPERSGRLSVIIVDEKVKNLGYVAELVFEKKESENIFAAPEGYDCIGWVTVFGESSQDAQKNLAEVKQYIQYRID
ncbi:MAG: ATP-grasp domain-containing protein [Candidatus Magasanikbacteria bacterium]|nr:ATP-grasp domain-containing protein [Candidatus Magasanikbacteria bacterium]